MNPPVTLNVHMQAAPGQEARLRSALESLLAPTRAEAGCLNYDLHVDPADRSKFMFYENWRDQAALDEHLATPHIKNFLAQNETLLARPMVLTSWRKLG